MAKKKNDIFWASYADLMTALFVMMLALFVLSYKLFTDKNSELEVMAEQYQKIKEIEAALSALEGEYFRFDPENKRHELIIPIEFQSSQAVILPRYEKRLYEAGKMLNTTIKNIQTDQPVRYTLIIEGMAARYTQTDKLWRNTDPAETNFAYLLSYQRALARYRFWESKGISFDRNTFEIIIAGSGFQGAGRYTGKEEPKNKRFLIQIIPKVGTFTRQQAS